MNGSNLSQIKRKRAEAHSELPPDWIKCQSKSVVAGRTYFFNVQTGESCWDISDLPEKSFKERDSSSRNSVKSVAEKRNEEKTPLERGRKRKRKRKFEPMDLTESSPKGPRPNFSFKLPSADPTTETNAPVIMESHAAKDEEEPMEVDLIPVLVEFRREHSRTLPSKVSFAAKVGDLRPSAPVDSPLHVVFDTNILLGQLDLLKAFRDFGCLPKGSRTMIAVIPWVVLQELDQLKDFRRYGNSNQETRMMKLKAGQAVKYIEHVLEFKMAYFSFQTCQDDFDQVEGLRVEGNDDRILKCCFQLSARSPSSSVLLCTQDINFNNKARVSGVTTISVKELKQKLVDALNTHSSFPPGAIVLPLLHVIIKDSVTAGKTQEKEVEKFQHPFPSLFVLTVKKCLEAVLREEMKDAFPQNWEEIVCRKPPWHKLSDVLFCFKKHWLAVFRYVYPRSSELNDKNFAEWKRRADTYADDKDLNALLMEICQKALPPLPKARPYSGHVLEVLEKLKSLRGKPPFKPAPPSEALVDPSSLDKEEEMVVALTEAWAIIFKAGAAIVEGIGGTPGISPVPKESIDPAIALHHRPSFLGFCQILRCLLQQLVQQSSVGSVDARTVAEFLKELRKGNDSHSQSFNSRALCEFLSREEGRNVLEGALSQLGILIQDLEKVS